MIHEAQLTQTNAVAGTPQYMSPEQARGKPVDHRSDLFSLGCVMYAMCVGRSPFRSETPTGAIHRVCEDAPRPIREVNPEIPEWLVAIIDRLLEKKPEDRFQTADEVAAVLGQYLAHVQQPSRVSLPEPSLRATSVASGGRRLRPMTRNALLGGVACLILLVVGSVWIADSISSNSPSGATKHPPNPPSAANGEFISNAGKQFLLVNLQDVANYGLDQATDSPGNDLSELKPGIEFLNGTPVQFGAKYLRLRGMNLQECPDRIRDVFVGAEVDRLHFVHGAQYAGEEGTQICQYEIQYEDKSTDIVPVLTGGDVWDWWRDPKHAERGEIAWLGTNSRSIEKNKLLLLFRSTWINPRPDVKIIKIGMSKTPPAKASPFCVAITAELPGRDSSPSEGARLHVNLDLECFELVPAWRSLSNDFRRREKMDGPPSRTRLVSSGACSEDGRGRHRYSRGNDQSR